MKVRLFDGSRKGFNHDSVCIYITPHELEILNRWNEGNGHGIATGPENVDVYSINVATPERYNALPSGISHD